MADKRFKDLSLSELYTLGGFISDQWCQLALALGYDHVTCNRFKESDNNPISQAYEMFNVIRLQDSLGKKTMTVGQLINLCVEKNMLAFSLEIYEIFSKSLFQKMIGSQELLIRLV